MSFETRLTGELIERFTRSGHWGSETFSQILERRAAAHPERELLVDRRHRITYGELKARVDRVAAKLGALGIGRGDVVTIQLPNWVEFAYVFFALERLGAVANQIGPDFRARDFNARDFNAKDRSPKDIGQDVGQIWPGCWRSDRSGALNMSMLLYVHV